MTRVAPITCPHCGRQFDSPFGVKGHIQTCAKYPGEDALRADREANMSYKAMGRKYNVSGKTAHNWCDEVGLSEPLSQWVRRLRIFPGYAPRRGVKVMACEGCPAYQWCRQLVKIGWVLCEAPDMRQLKSLERRGFDFTQVTTEIWARAPEIWEV